MCLSSHGLVSGGGADFRVADVIGESLIWRKISLTSDVCVVSKLSVTLAKLPRDILLDILLDHVAIMIGRSGIQHSVELLILLGLATVVAAPKEED